MNKMTALLALPLFLLACAHESPEPQRYPAELRSGESLANAPVCDAETACPDGLECAYVDLVDGDDQARCVDMNTICDRLDCGDGDCLVLESYPVQIMCAAPGGDGDSDGDDSTSNP